MRDAAAGSAPAAALNLYCVRNACLIGINAETALNRNKYSKIVYIYEFYDIA